MNSKPTSSLFIIVTLVVGIVAFAPSAFAQSTASVTVATGSGSGQACVAANNCFDPAVTKIDVGGTVTWTNTDAQTHTISSGKPSDDTYETGNNNAVPEFGPIASLVLVIAIVSVIAVTAKTRGFLKI
ncbi:MAG: PEFG-CTERM sorting domain-containing protein [Thaumarchaeota archaeon]|nr:PEFG-CTERM sorting domain-containing protein [Nitrososphaerota archaeon]